MDNKRMNGRKTLESIDLDQSPDPARRAISLGLGLLPMFALLP